MITLQKLPVRMALSYGHINVLVSAIDGGNEV